MGVIDYLNLKPSIQARLMVIIFSFLLIVYVVMTAVAMKLYPGGSSIDHSTIGHRFWLNYLCDLSQPLGLNGQPNPGAIWGRTALMIFSLLTACFWWLLPLVMDDFPLRKKLVRWMGVVSAFFAVLIPVTPSEQFGIIH